MDIQTILTYVIVLIAALYAGRSIWKGLITPESSSTSCACGSKRGCAALSQNMDRLLKDLEVLTEKPTENAP